jgi:hypothetical protein
MTGNRRKESALLGSRPFLPPQFLVSHVLLFLLFYAVSMEVLPSLQSVLPMIQK